MWNTRFSKKQLFTLHLKLKLVATAMQFLKMKVSFWGKYLKYISFLLKIFIFFFQNQKSVPTEKCFFQIIGDIEKGGKWKNKCLCYHR